jgi:acyl carrier protein
MWAAWWSVWAARVVHRRPSPIPLGMGRWGMGLFIEPSVRRLVAERLGVRIEDLISAVSLRGDLAADSLDLIDLTVALEAEFAIAVPDRVMNRAGTYGELVEAIGRLILARREAESHAAELPHVWVRILPPKGASRGTLERADWWTPYTAELITADVRRAGYGARVDVTVSTSSSAGCARVRLGLARAVEDGVELSVRRDDRPPVPPAATPVDAPVEMPSMVVGSDVRPGSWPPYAECRPRDEAPAAP